MLILIGNHPGINLKIFVTLYHGLFLHSLGYAKSIYPSIKILHDERDTNTKK